MNFCSICRDVEVKDRRGHCGHCQKELEQGYMVRSLAGRARSGIDTHGTLFHAIAFDQHIAFCGAKPGRRSIGWSLWGKGQDANCKRCLRKLDKIK